MQIIPLENLVGQSRADLVSLNALAAADGIYIRDIDTENDRLAFGTLIDRQLKPGAITVCIPLNTQNVGDLHRILNRIALIKGYQDYYGVRRSTTIGVSEMEQFRDRCQKQLMTIVSNRGKCIFDMLAAAHSSTDGLVFRFPKNAEEVIGTLDWRDKTAIEDGLHAIQVYVEIRSPMADTQAKTIHIGACDARGGLPKQVAKLLRDHDQFIAIDCEAMASRVEDVESDPFEPKARAWVVRDALTEKTISAHAYYAYALDDLASYQREICRDAEIIATPIQEWEELQYIFEGAAVGIAAIDLIRI